MFASSEERQTVNAVCLSYCPNERQMKMFNFLSFAYGVVSSPFRYLSQDMAERNYAAGRNDAIRHMESGITPRWFRDHVDAKYRGIVRVDGPTPPSAEYLSGYLAAIDSDVR